MREVAAVDARVAAEIAPRVPRCRRRRHARGLRNSHPRPRQTNARGRRRRRTRRHRNSPRVTTELARGATTTGVRASTEPSAYAQPPKQPPAFPPNWRRHRGGPGACSRRNNPRGHRRGWARPNSRDNQTGADKDRKES